MGALPDWLDASHRDRFAIRVSSDRHTISDSRRRGCQSRQQLHASENTPRANLRGAAGQRRSRSPALRRPRPSPCTPRPRLAHEAKSRIPRNDARDLAHNIGLANCNGAPRVLVLSIRAMLSTRLSERAAVMSELANSSFSRALHAARYSRFAAISSTSSCVFLRSDPSAYSRVSPLTRARPPGPATRRRPRHH